MTVTIYHNPRCSKSRETLALHRNARHRAEDRRLSEDAALGCRAQRHSQEARAQAARYLRDSEPRYAELGLKDRKLDDDALMALMVANPILIERPIVVNGNKAAIGRPPEKVLEIL